MPVVTRSMAVQVVKQAESKKVGKRKNLEKGKTVNFDAEVSSPVAKKLRGKKEPQEESSKGTRGKTKGKGKSKKQRQVKLPSAPQQSSSPAHPIKDCTIQPDENKPKDSTGIPEPLSILQNPVALEPMDISGRIDSENVKQEKLCTSPCSSMTKNTISNANKPGEPIPKALTKSKVSVCQKPRFASPFPDPEQILPIPSQKSLMNTTIGWKTPDALQKTLVFVKPGNTSVRRSQLQPHEELIQTPKSLWNIPPIPLITPPSCFRTPFAKKFTSKGHFTAKQLGSQRQTQINPCNPTATPLVTPHPSLKTPFANVDTPKGHFTPTQLESLRHRMDRRKLNGSDKKQVSFNDTVSDDFFTSDDRSPESLRKDWKPPRKATPVTNAFMTGGSSSKSSKKVSFSEDTNCSDGPSRANKSTWVAPRLPTPVSCSSFAPTPPRPVEGSPSPVNHNAFRKTSSRRLTYSLDKSMFGLPDVEEESPSCVGYELSEYEEVPSSQEADVEFLKLQRRATKLIPEWAQGDSLTISLVKMVPLVSNNVLIRRVFPPMTDEDGRNKPSLYPEVGFAYQMVSDTSIGSGDDETAPDESQPAEIFDGPPENSTVNE